MRKMMYISLIICILTTMAPLAFAENTEDLATGGFDGSFEGMEYPDYPMGIQDGPIDVALVCSDSEGRWVEVINYLSAFPDLVTIDVIAVLVWSNYVYFDPIALGDVLADYVDAGGGVVLATFSWYDQFYLDGRIMTDYSPFAQVGPSLYSRADMGWFDSSHPIMQGVSSISGYYRDDVALTPGAVLVAEWVDGDPFVATKETVVGISLYPSVTLVPDSDWTGEVPTLIHNALVWAAEPEPPFEYSFQLNPFIDVVHINVDMPDMWIHGINEAGWVAPVLGKAEGGKVYWACDLPAGGIEMYFVEIDIATRAGYMYRIYDDMTITGPDEVWLTPVAGEAEGVSTDEASGAEASPQSTYKFQINPFSDIAYVHDDIKPWLYGYQDVPGVPGYPAPLLGYARGGRFFWAADFVDGHGGYELYICAGTISSRDADYIITVDGYSYDGPLYMWLTPASSTVSYKGAMAEID
jgi:hypothetical protein